MDVYVTNDVEIWCNGWDNLDKEFPSAFKRYIYGETSHGNFGLPFQLELLARHDLKSVFFVEPLFATRFGEVYLAEVIQLIQQAGQEVQLHLHPEWTDEAQLQIIQNCQHKRQHLFMYSLEEQTALVKKAKQLLLDNGCEEVTAFRAGSFAANLDTLKALFANQLYIDSSYNPTLPECRLNEADLSAQDPLVEFPMTAFQDYPGHRRHLQLTACSFREIKHILLQAEKQQWDSIVILMHSFEFLNADKTQPDWVVIKRFEKLCKFLADNRDKFTTCGFSDVTLNKLGHRSGELNSNWCNYALRVLEQAYRRLRY
jgi:hypothetical protein